MKTKDPEYYKKKAYEWYHNNLEKAREQARTRYAKNREKLVLRQKEWYVKNREKVIKYRRSLRYKKSSAAWRLANYEKCRDGAMRCNYGIGIKEYNEILKSQGGVCAICGTIRSYKNRWGGINTRMHIDHCSITGKVRGILCNKCNLGIGYFDHDVNRISSAASYLQIHSSSSYSGSSSSSAQPSGDSRSHIVLPSSASGFHAP